MAIAIIFGLVFATVLTLGVVPVLYSLFYRVCHDARE
jgi:multidrug efflux pump subunit AcrB